jgi:hypothetical protein
MSAEDAVSQQSVDDVECSICLQQLRVPVKIKAFNCPRTRGKPSCNDLKRLCLCCARKYLYLNIPVRSRPTSAKCLFCPTTCDPRDLNADLAYEKDYMLMSLMTRKDYPCFHSELGCSFTGGQHEVDHHITNVCEYRTTRCQCGTFHTVINTPDHYQNCRYYRQCPCCKDWKHVDVIFRHIETDHHSKFCMYCHKIHPLRTIAAHQQTCTMRPVSCEICHNHVMYSRMGEHLMSHVSTASQEMKNCMQQLKNATGALERFHSV